MQWSEKMRQVTYAVIACCLAANGCAIDWLVDYDQPASIEEYQARYSNFGDPWVGHQVEELIVERGLPDDVFDAMSRRPSFPHGIHVLSYIYYNETAEGRSCIEAFVAVDDSGTIVRYYCR
jgi:hypothetical protein